MDESREGVGMNLKEWKGRGRMIRFILERLFQNKKGESLCTSSRLRLQLTSPDSDLQKTHQKTALTFDGAQNRQPVSGQAGMTADITDDVPAVDVASPSSVLPCTAENVEAIHSRNVQEGDTTSVTSTTQHTTALREPEKAARSMRRIRTSPDEQRKSIDGQPGTDKLAHIGTTRQKTFMDGKRLPNFTLGRTITAFTHQWWKWGYRELFMV